MPAASTRAPVLRPRPGRRRTERGSSTSRTLSGVTWVSPSGFMRSEAILATSLFGATHAAAAVPADDERLAGQPRVVVLLDGRVERIHVDVQDRARHGVSPLFAVVRARAARAAELTG